MYKYLFKSQNNRIIAVNYPARDRGVTRHMRGDEAKSHCPEIELVSVPAVREKADLTKYREAGKDVAEVLQTFTNMLERASVDEAYLDITERVVEKMKLMNEGKFRLEPDKLSNTFAMGYDSIGEFVKNLSSSVDKNDSEWNDEENLIVYKKSDIKLLIAAAIVNDIRASVKQITGYECSAGIAHNKILAKLACGMNKPNKQTILPLQKIPGLLATLPLNKVKGLGGKFGELVSEKLKIKYVGDLRDFSEQELNRQFDDKNGSWLHLIGRGIDLEVVTPKFVSKSIGCCKKFPGRNAITSVATLNHWFGELAKEIMERLEKDEIENKRKAKQMTVSFAQSINDEDISSSRSVPLTSYDAEIIGRDAFETVKRNTEIFFKADNNNILNNAIKFLGISVGKFENNVDSQKSKLQEMFQNHAKKKEVVIENVKKPENTIKTFLKTKSYQEVNEDCERKTENESEPIKLAAKPDPKKSFFEKYLLKSSVETTNLELNEESESEQPVINDIDAQNYDEPSFDNHAEDSSECDVVNDYTNVINEPLPTTSTSISVVKTSTLISASSSKNSGDYEMGESSNSTTQTLIEDYKTTYLEYYKPPGIEIVKVECEKCGKPIPDFEYTSHLDFHFALDLSQQQRVDFRNEIKQKASKTHTASPPIKKQKKSQSQRDAKIPSIDTFLVKSTLSQPQIPIINVPSSDNTTNETFNESIQTFDTEKCTECEKFIRITDLLEHSDYHAAQRLQSEMNSSSSVSTNLAPKPSFSKKAKKNTSNSVLTYFKKSLT